MKGIWTNVCLKNYYIYKFFRVQEELEALEAILMDDITISYNEKWQDLLYIVSYLILLCFSGCADLVKSTIFPSTANEVEKQYVCVTLEAKLPEGYPDEQPVVQLRNPRGLDDTTINHLYQAIREKCNEFVGQPVIFELIEVRDYFFPNFLASDSRHRFYQRCLVYTYKDFFMDTEFKFIRLQTSDKIS